MGISTLERFSTDTFIVALQERAARLEARLEAVERERGRLDGWQTSGADECRLLVSHITDLQNEIQAIRKLIAPQQGLYPRWLRLAHSLDALSRQGDEAAIHITAYSARCASLSVEALRARRDARDQLHTLIFETKALQEVLAALLERARVVSVTGGEEGGDGQ
jgi:hypothetical protein